MGGGGDLQEKLFRLSEEGGNWVRKWSHSGENDFTQSSTEEGEEEKKAERMEKEERFAICL